MTDEAADPIATDRDRRTTDGSSVGKGSTGKSSADTAVTIAIMVIAALAPILGALVPRGMAPLLITGTLAITVAFRLHSGRWPPVRGSWVSVLAAFVALAALSLAWSPVPDDGVEQVVQFLALFGPALLLVAAASRAPAATHAGRLLLVAFVAGTALLVLELAAGLPLHNLVRGRLALDGDPTELNRNLVVMAALVWPAMLVPWLRGRRLLALLLPLGLAIPVAWGESQSAQIGIPAGLAVLAAATAAPEWTRRALMALTVLAFVGIMPFVAQLHAVALDSEILPFSARHRLEIWNFTSERIAEKPLLGWGIEASRELGASRISEDLGGGAELMPLHPHNAFLQVWLELGAVGAAISLAILLLLLHGIGKLRPAAKAPAMAAYAAGMAMIAVSYGIWQSWWLSALLLTAALIVACARPAEVQPRP
ncbi:MAG TPA: O-antigen ligase family protein, partial [Arenibaculum sp.]|nr:O-antigen ligase family protein [Arenibaculum sp.]